MCRCISLVVTEKDDALDGDRWYQQCSKLISATTYSHKDCHIEFLWRGCLWRGCLWIPRSFSPSKTTHWNWKTIRKRQTRIIKTNQKSKNSDITLSCEACKDKALPGRSQHPMASSKQDAKPRNTFWRASQDSASKLSVGSTHARNSNHKRKIWLRLRNQTLLGAHGSDSWQDWIFL